jgi:diguanylate cyclase (GGDEF)-like protein
VILLDLDHFKDFNDQFGHAAGDAVLREVGRFLAAHVRGSDIACRYGGEEFVLVFPEAELPVVIHRAEELRDGIRRLVVPDSDRQVGAVTASIGAAGFPEHGANAAEIMQAVDEALYRAKTNGRDRVEVAAARAEA